MVSSFLNRNFTIKRCVVRHIFRSDGDRFHPAMGTVPIRIKVFPAGIPVPDKTAGRKGIRDLLIPRIHPAAKDAALPLIPEDVHPIHHQFRPVHLLCIDLIDFSRNHLDLGGLP